jgi:hypothetical protein
LINTFPINTFLINTFLINMFLINMFLINTDHGRNCDVCPYQPPHSAGWSSCHAGSRPRAL